MPLSAKIESFIEQLPDADGARRFYAQLAEKFPAEEKKLVKNEGLVSDVLSLAAFSPLLATTMLQNPAYIFWLNRQRVLTTAPSKDEIIESLARFALTNSDVETNVLLARFRRRELLRIYLRDIRELETVVEITEEISNLAAAILEYALRQATQELDNRYGAPFEANEKSRVKPAEFCIVALGKLGSAELNYASDIDLLFLYSADGATGGQSARGAVTNREYFVKLAETVTRIVGAPTGEGAAYRVDLRLRPNGRVGALAISLNEAVNYYRTTARVWERQVLIRARAAAGAADVFHKFYEQVKSSVFSIDETVENALRSVRLSKEKINAEKTSDPRFNVKLGKGGIREIEFVAQALQLAFGGADEWLRAPHTLISLARLADRELISETEQTDLFEAYEFLRRLEHRLQMENGLQTHFIPNDAPRRAAVARRMKCENVETFEALLKKHTENVNRVFARVFGAAENAAHSTENLKTELNADGKNSFSPNALPPVVRSVKKSDSQAGLNAETEKTLAFLSKTAAHFAAMIAANPTLIKNLPNADDELTERNYREILISAVAAETTFKLQLAVLRKNWSRFILEIAVFDAFGKITRQHSKRLQTALAEASIEAAIFITKLELGEKYSVKIEEFSFAVLGLGKLGGGGMDYGSDLDLVLIYDDEKSPPVETLSPGEFYSRAVEIFVNVLSSLTREGLLYRVDLRLRPDGKNGATSISRAAFLHYLETRSAVWEWLAYVKLRGAAGDLELAKKTELEARRIIHENARRLEIENSESAVLIEESRRIRERLETEKSTGRNGKEIDIKFGAGGMLDVYFAVRFLQLRDNIYDSEENRSTVFTLRKLYENQSLIKEDFQNFAAGYDFLTELDHQMRLTVGRSSRLPIGNQTALQIVAERMKFAAVKNLLEQLTVHRLNIRASFENIFREQRTRGQI